MESPRAGAVTGDPAAHGALIVAKKAGCLWLGKAQLRERGLDLFGGLVYGNGGGLCTPSDSGSRWIFAVGLCDSHLAVCSLQLVANNCAGSAFEASSAFRTLWRGHAPNLDF
jgi:hypothetical protein